MSLTKFLVSYIDTWALALANTADLRPVSHIKLRSGTLAYKSVIYKIMSSTKFLVSYIDTLTLALGQYSWPQTCKPY